MRTITYQVTRKIYSKEEREIKKCWNNWKELEAQQDLRGHVILLVGTWSGYSGQSNCDTTSYRYCSLHNNSLDHPIQGRILFTDNTQLIVQTIEISLQEILDKKIRPVLGYQEIVREMLLTKDLYLNLND